MSPFLSCIMAVTLGAPFGDHMVLQRDRPIRIWGQAKPAECVTVTFADQSVSTTASTDGTWRVILKPMPANTTGRTLTVTTQPSHSSQTSRTSHTSHTSHTSLSDILVGEVWLASGQSNMACPTWSNSPRFRDESGMFMAYLTRQPLLRYTTVQGKAAEKPQTALARPLQWRAAVPDNLTKIPLSAVAFYFARELQQVLDVPVGIIAASVGGTNVDAWIPQSGLVSVPDLENLANWTFLPSERWSDPAVRKFPIDGYQQQPTALWNGYLAPLAPLTVKGLIWYQGERNQVAGEAGPRYHAKLRALYNGWSKEFDDPAFKFYVVQLCSWGPDISAFQETQRRFCDSEPNAHLAVINDVGDPKDIHPSRKEPVGRRLAALALKHEYGFTDIPADAPTLKLAVANGDRVTLTFNDARVLSLHNAARTAESGIELAGPDGQFRPAKIVNLHPLPVGDISFGAIDGRELVVTAEGVAKPCRVRYLAAPPRTGCLFNECNLPVAAFEKEVEAAVAK